MNKTLKILAVVFSVVLLLSGIAVFAALNTPVNAVELVETGKWTGESEFTYNGTPYTVQKDEAYTGKYIDVSGTKWYLVDDATDFAKVKGTSAANFIIAKDFSITTTGTTENQQTLRLATIDGCGHTITVSGSAGLFGNFSGKVTNLEIAGDISAASHTSAFAQWCWGAHFDTVVNRVNITDTSTKADFAGYNAGFVGYVRNDNSYSASHDGATYTAVFENCYNYGNVTASNAKGRAAGFVSSTRESGTTVKFVSCTNYGTMTNNSNSDNGVGGFISVMWANGGNVTFVDCVNEGTISSKINAGGFIGRLEAGPTANFTGCTNNGAVSANNTIAGGFVGDVKSAVNLTNCTNSGAVKATDVAAGGFLGKMLDTNKTATLTDCTNSGVVSSTNGKHFGGFVGVQTGASNITFNSCENEADLSGIQYIAGFLGSSQGSGTTNFNNSTNSGNITATGPENGCFVGTAWGGNGKLNFNACTNDGNMSGTAKLGGFVGVTWAATNTVTFTNNCVNNGSITGTGETAGFIAFASGPVNISDSVNNGAITTNSHAGGFVSATNNAAALLTLTDCTNNATVTVTKDGFAGGLIARTLHGANLTNCVNSSTAKVINNSTSGDKEAGGIIGDARLGTASVTLTGCKNYGEVSSAQRVGGIIGNAAHTSWNASDGTGTLTVTNCENAGTVKGTGTGVAGIVGYYESYSVGINVKVENCTNSGAVSTNNYCGGIMGDVVGNVTVNKCVNTGTVTNKASSGTYQPAGIIAKLQMKNRNTSVADNFVIVVTNNANYGTISSTDASAGIIGCHSAPYVGMNWVNNANQAATTINATETVTVANNFNAGACIRNAGKENQGLCGGIVNWSHLGGSNANFKNNYTTAAANSNGYDTTTVSALQAASGEVAYKLGAAWGQTLGTDAYPIPGGATVYNVALKATAEGNELAKTYSNTNAAKIISLAHEGVERRDDAKPGYRVLTSISAYDYEALKAAGIEFELGTLITANKYGVSTYEELKAVGKPCVIVTAINGAWYESSTTEYTFAGSLLEIKDANLDMEYAVRGYIEIDGTIIYTDAQVVVYNNLAA